MYSQSKSSGSADISASTYDKIRTIPARLHCASHRRDNAPHNRAPPREVEERRSSAPVHAVVGRHRFHGLALARYWTLMHELTTRQVVEFLRCRLLP